MTATPSSRAAALTHLLTELFSEAELRRLLKLADLNDLTSAESTGSPRPRSLMAMALCAALVLDELGLVDRELRPTLTRLFPASRAEIAAAQGWGVRELLVDLFSHYRKQTSSAPVGTPGLEMCLQLLPSGPAVCEAMNRGPRPYEAAPDDVVARAVVAVIDADPRARAAFVERVAAARSRRADEIRGWASTDLATKLPLVATGPEMAAFLFAACGVAPVRALEQRLPPTPASAPRTLMHEVAGALDRAPMYAAPLFAALTAERPRRARDIAPVAALWGL